MDETRGGEAIALISPFEFGTGLVYSLVYVTFGPLAFFSRGGIIPDLGWAINVILLALMTVLWLYLMAGLRSMTWFTPGEDRIKRRNLFGVVRFIPHKRIARVGMVMNAGVFGAGTNYFRLVDKKRPLGKGFRLTGNYRPDDPELPVFLNEILPAINVVVFGDANGPAVPQAEAEANAGIPPEAPDFYKKNGAVYSRRRFSLAMLLYLPGVYFLYSGLQLLFFPGRLDHLLRPNRSPADGISLLVFALICFIYPLFSALTIAFDVDKGELALGKYFGWRMVRIPLNDSFRVVAQRSYGNFLYLGTTLLLQFRDANGRECEQALGTAHFFAGTLPALEAETRHILTAALVKKASGRESASEIAPNLRSTVTEKPNKAK